MVYGDATRRSRALTTSTQRYYGPDAVNTDIHNVDAKLGMRDRSAAVQHARRLRLVSNRISPNIGEISLRVGWCNHLIPASPAH
jgi:hypothetical protein